MKKATAFLLCLTILFFCGCTSNYMNQTAGDSIPPVQDSNIASSSRVMPLYFRYYDEPMLLRYPLNIEITNHEHPEFYAISALLTDSFGQRPEFTYCFKGATKLISVEAENQYLTVTLSDGFYEDTKGATDEQTRLNRSLAIYSIVNTVCEMGNYSYVQFYIERNGASLRPDSYEMGIVKNQADSTPLGPLSRNTSLLLTPSNVAKTGLLYYSQRQWDKLYLYLGDSEPLLEELTQEFNYLNIVLDEFTVEDNYTVSEDGKKAIVQVSVNLRSGDAGYEFSNVPLELVYSGRSWLISYKSLMRHLGVKA